MSPQWRSVHIPLVIWNGSRLMFSKVKLRGASGGRSVVWRDGTSSTLSCVMTSSVARALTDSNGKHSDIAHQKLVPTPIVTRNRSSF